MPLLSRRAFTLAALAACSGPAPAQNAWPTRPVKIIVPAPAGSSLDVIARALSEKLSARWAQPVLVDNKPGAGGLLGMDAVAKAGDGHTLGIGFNGPIAFAPFLYRKMPYEPRSDLLPIVMTTAQPNVLAIRADHPARTVKELVDWAKANPGKLNYSSLGNGSSAHLTMELFFSEAGIVGTHIPFNGSPPAAMAVAQGEADISFMVAPALLVHVRNHKIRMLAVSSALRPDSLRELPTLAEAGYPQVESLAWNGIFAPAGMPAQAAARIEADVNDLLADAAVKSLLEAQGLTVVGGSGAQFGRTLEAERRRWGPIIQKIGLKLD